MLAFYYAAILIFSRLSSCASELDGLTDQRDIENHGREYQCSTDQRDIESSKIFMYVFNI